jgi:L-ribulokinase
MIEAADWIVWRMTGQETRNSCTAGYKGLWSKRAGFPAERYYAALDPRLGRMVDEKMSRAIRPIGDRAGTLTPEAARWTGLRPGTAVAIANVDAHVSVPAATVTRPGRMVMIMGTSICHMVLGTEEREVEGMCGVVEDGIIPGLYGFEAGQSGVGDIFAWFVENMVPPEYHALARKRKTGLHNLLEQEAARLAPGEAGMVALDWWNGNRSVLVNVDLTGLLLVVHDLADHLRQMVEQLVLGASECRLIGQLEKVADDLTALTVEAPERQSDLRQPLQDLRDFLGEYQAGEVNQYRRP